LSANEIQKRVRNAIEWYKNFTYNAFRRPGDFRSYPSSVEENSGNMFLFTYNAKHADKLRYWDRRPLMIPLGPAQRAGHTGNILGLNLHYLPPNNRAQLLNAMRSQMQTGDSSQYFRIMATYEKLAANPKAFPGYNECIHEYIPTRISNAARIDPRDWEHVVMLPPTPTTGPIWAVKPGFSPPY
jgi:hypothetical protein